MDPYVFYTLPPPLILPPLHLILIYLAVFCLDYVLLRQQRGVRFVILYHILLAVFLVSPSQPLNIFFTAVPIYVVSFTGHLAQEKLQDPVRWIKALATDIVEEEQGGRVRLHGLAKICRGVFKVSLLVTVLDPIWHQGLGVSPWTTDTLMGKWYDPWTLVYNLLLGITAYCLLGTVDIFLGAEQAISGVRFMDLFNSPLLASSPRDFWSRRWNRVVRQQFHTQFFLPPLPPSTTTTTTTTTTSISISGKKLQRKGFWESRNGRGLVVFMLSGVLHELILWSNCRDITLENFAFFTLHGVAVMVETNLTRNQRRQSLVELWLCRLAFMVFMTLSARLFLAPFIRHDFWAPLGGS